jgi:hypothetical protein
MFNTKSESKLPPTSLTYISKYNKQDATLHNLFISMKCSTCFRRYLRPSSRDQNCIYSIGYLSNLYCCLPLSWKSSNSYLFMYLFIYIHEMLYMFHAVPPPIIRSSKTVYTASGTCQTFTAACRYRGRIPTLIYLFIYLYLWNALHVSGGTSAHHQELKTVYTASGTCQTLTAACRYSGRVPTFPR